MSANLGQNSFRVARDSGHDRADYNAHMIRQHCCNTADLLEQRGRLLFQPHPSHQVLKSRVAAQRVEARLHFEGDQTIGVLRVGLF
jgi:hypothetical protein